MQRRFRSTMPEQFLRPGGARPARQKYSRFVLARFTSTGCPDATFAGGHGITSTGLPWQMLPREKGMRLRRHVLATW